MESIKYRNALYEVAEILKYINNDSKNKIPDKLIEYIEKNKSTDYKFTINKNIPIEEQKLLPQTEAFITIIYRDYLCPKNRREEVTKIIQDSDLEFEIELKEKYKKEDIFKKKEVIQKLPVEKKENFFRKFIDYIKYITLKKG